MTVIKIPNANSARESHTHVRCARDHITASIRLEYALVLILAIVCSTDSIADNEVAESAQQRAIQGL